MKLFSIFGNPVSHSISPKMHNLALHALHLEGGYVRTPLEDGSTLRQTFEAWKMDGANVTVPHKEEAFKQCDEIRGLATKIGAINTIVKEKGKLIGYNTDAPGFMRSIAPFGVINTALILGAGGTAKALALALKESDIEVHVLNRSDGRLGDFKAKGFTTSNWENFTPKEYDLIVNTTSAGLSDEALPLPKELLEPTLEKASFAFDVIYNKPTAFLSLAREKGLTCKDGADMLLYQGVLAFNLFFGNSLSEAKITKAMKEAFTL